MHAIDTIFVYTSDLRTEDHRGLDWAHQQGSVLPLYIHDMTGKWRRPPGGASRWWLHHSLASLGSQIQKESGRLALFAGDSLEILDTLCRSLKPKHLVYMPVSDTRGKKFQQSLMTRLQPLGVQVEAIEDATLQPVGSVQTKDGGTYKVFTPFWRALQQTNVPLPTGRKKRLWLAWPQVKSESTLESLDLLPKIPWDSHFSQHWAPSAAQAHQAIKAFSQNQILRYESSRNIPSVVGTSRLSPHLAFGEIHPQRIWHTVLKNSGVASFAALPESTRVFLSEVAWRDFAFNTLRDAPDLAETSIKPAFDAFPWETQHNDWLEAWQRGQTGYPIVDAGMRELWATGFMHNRVRMIVGSFLVKHLRMDWRRGEQWFWDTLLDACPANNPQNWQWVAGCGRDAAPYFRVFNPILQAEKFDPQGLYIKHWVPELKAVTGKDVYDPHHAKSHSGKLLYPKPVVNHAQARILALQAFQSIKAGDA